MLARCPYAERADERAARDEWHAREAATLHHESLALFRDLGSRWRVVECLEGLAQLAASTAQPKRLAYRYGVAQALREAMGMPLPTGERDGYERNLAAA
jgi:hypothetical protein